MVSQRWTKSKTSVHNVAYHLIWCPKYRRKVLTDQVEIRLKQLLYEKSKSNGYSIESMEIMPDHVHLFIKTKPNISVSAIIKHLKGYSSFKLRNKFSDLKKYKSLWTHSYYCETIGLISENNIIKYIAMQKTK